MQAIEPVVDRDVRVDQALEHVHDAGVGLRRRRVRGGGTLVVAPREIDGHVPLLDVTVAASFTGSSVMPSPSMRMSARSGRRETREGGPGPPLRVAQELLQVVGEGGGPVL